MSQPQQINLENLWRFVTNQMKARVTMPSLWRALEAAKPITMENGELILGFGVETAHQSSLLLDSRYRNTIEQVLQMATRQKTRIRTINGESIEEWESIKQSEVEAQRLLGQSRQQYQKQLQQDDNWESIGEQLIRRYNQTANRALPTVQGRFLIGALDTLLEAYPKIMPPRPAEVDERALSRVIERLSERVMVPAPTIGFLLHQRLAESAPPTAGEPAAEGAAEPEGAEPAAIDAAEPAAPAEEAPESEASETGAAEAAVEEEATDGSGREAEGSDGEE
jgi:hypothetical protein